MKKSKVNAIIKALSIVAIAFATMLALWMLIEGLLYFLEVHWHY